jgi:thiol:disulfide interchange protein DsbA
MTSNPFRFPKFAITLSVLLFLASPLHAEEFEEGVDYETLPGEVKVQADGRVEVIEFFWFGCPSCYRFEPHLVAWQIPETIDFKNVPAVLTNAWLFHAHVYYAMELLGLKEELMQKFYDELHIERTRISGDGQFEQWASSQEGVDVSNLTQNLYSFATVVKLGQAEKLAKDYNITSVPTLIVGGKYKTSPSMARSEKRALQIVEYLADRILSEQSASN